MSVILALFEKIWFSMHTNIPEYWLPCWLAYSVYFLFNYIFIKYLFICEKYFVILSIIVYFTRLFFFIHFQMI